MWVPAPWPGIAPGPLALWAESQPLDHQGSPLSCLWLTLTHSSRHSLGPTHISLGPYHCHELQTTPNSQFLHLCSWRLFLNPQQVARKCQKMRALMAAFNQRPVEFGASTAQLWTCLVVQWLRICLPMQGTWVRSLVRKDPTCHGAMTTTNSHYYSSTAVDAALQQ